MEQKNEFKVPTEVYVNKVKTEDGKIDYQLSGQRQDDESIVYIRSDIFNGLFNQAKDALGHEAKDAVEICSNTIELSKMENGLLTIKTYLIAILFILAFVFLRDITLFLTVAIITLLNIILGSWINGYYRQKYDKMMQEKEAERKKRNEEKQKEAEQRANQEAD